LSLLDQALAYVGSGPHVHKGSDPNDDVQTSGDAARLLPDEFLVGFASALLERKPSGVLEWIKQLVEEGWDIPQFVRDFREFLRQTLVEQLGQSKNSDVLQMAGRSATLAEILHMIK